MKYTILHHGVEMKKYTILYHCLPSCQACQGKVSACRLQQQARTKREAERIVRSLRKAGHVGAFWTVPTARVRAAIDASRRLDGVMVDFYGDYGDQASLFALCNPGGMRNVPKGSLGRIREFMGPDWQVGFGAL